jgi:hypothetical protein
MVMERYHKTPKYKEYMDMIRQFGVFKDIENIFNDEKYLFSRKFYHKDFDNGEKWAELRKTTTLDWEGWR